MKARGGIRLLTTHEVNLTIGSILRLGQSFDWQLYDGWRAGVMRWGWEWEWEKAICFGGEGMKARGGIRLLTTHAAYYTMDGGRLRD